MFMKYIIVLVAIYLLPLCASTKPNCAGPPPSSVNPRDCCEKATVIDNSIFESCFSKFDMSKQPPKEGKGLKGPLMNAECPFECILNSTKFMENGKINVQNAVALITATLNNNNNKVWTPIVSAGITFCAAEANKNVEKMKSSLNGVVVNGITVCNPYSAYFVACMFTYEFRHCPADKYTNNAKCNELKEFFNACPTPTLN